MTTTSTTAVDDAEVARVRDLLGLTRIPTRRRRPFPAAGIPVWLSSTRTRREMVADLPPAAAARKVAEAAEYGVDLDEHDTYPAALTRPFADTTWVSLEAWLAYELGTLPADYRVTGRR